MRFSEVFLTCWLIVCIYVPIVLALTEVPSREERKIALGLNKEVR